jgi:hypothetical protein
MSKSRQINEDFENCFRYYDKELGNINIDNLEELQSILEIMLKMVKDERKKENLNNEQIY